MKRQRDWRRFGSVGAIRAFRPRSPPSSRDDSKPAGQIHGLVCRIEGFPMVPGSHRYDYFSSSNPSLNRGRSVMFLSESSVIFMSCHCIVCVCMCMNRKRSDHVHSPHPQKKTKQKRVNHHMTRLSLLIIHMHIKQHSKPSLLAPFPSYGHTHLKTPHPVRSG